MYVKCKRCGAGPFESQKQLAGHGRQCKASLPDGMGACSNCGILPVGEFYKPNDGWCKECFKNNSRETYANDPTYRKEHAKKRWKKILLDPILSEQYHTHYRAYMKEWRKTPQAKRHRASSRQRRRATINGLNEHFTTDEFADLIITYDQACPHCFQHEPTIHITPDHVQALANGGANSIDNIQPLCWGQNEKSSNRSKYDYRKGYRSLWFNLIFSSWYVPLTSPGTRKLPEGIKAYTLSDVSNAAQQRGYQLKSIFYANSVQTLDFVCHSGHLWQTSFKNFQNHNCPTCTTKRLGEERRVSYTADQISEMLKELTKE